MLDKKKEPASCGFSFLSNALLIIFSQEPAQVTIKK